jgi:hypothetical protein
LEAAVGGASRSQSPEDARSSRRRAVRSGDGSVQFLRTEIDRDALISLISRNGSEPSPSID